jgi:hypothetical protein
LIKGAGHKVTDSGGRQLSFSLGQILGKNHGTIACGNRVHPRVID